MSIGNESSSTTKDELNYDVNTAIKRANNLVREISSMADNDQDSKRLLNALAGAARQIAFSIRNGRFRKNELARIFITELINNRFFSGKRVLDESIAKTLADSTSLHIEEMKSKYGRIAVFDFLDFLIIYSTLWPEIE